jgi:anti-anti-sigma factor
MESIIIAVVGELDMAREHELLNLVITLDPPAESTVHIDMSDVTFVDSGGLNALLKAKAYLDGRHCELRLLNPQQQLLRIIDLVGLGDSLVVDLTVSELPGELTSRFDATRPSHPL